MAGVPTHGSTYSGSVCKYYHSYLLCSLDDGHPLKTYIGFTTDPRRRLRQHKGLLTSGARTTKKSGRPWTYVCIVGGFHDQITALQFEWAWQHSNKSRCFRDAVDDDAIASTMHRRRGANARLDELRVLLNHCIPFCLYSLTAYFPDSDYYDMYQRPHQKKYVTETCNSLSEAHMCSIDGLPCYNN